MPLSHKKNNAFHFFLLDILGNFSLPIDHVWKSCRPCGIQYLNILGVLKYWLTLICSRDSSNKEWLETPRCFFFLLTFLHAVPTI